MRMWKLWAFVVVLLSAGIAAAAEPSPGLRSLRRLNWPPPPSLGPSNGTWGWAFRVRQPVRLTHLGFYDAGKDGLRASHRVGIWNNQKQLLREALISEGQQTPRVRQYRYAEVRPALLRPGQTYVIGATVPFQPRAPQFNYDLFPQFDVDQQSIRLDKSVEVRAYSRLGLHGVNTLEGVEPPGQLAYPRPTSGDAFSFAANLLFEPVETKRHAPARVSIAEELRTEVLRREMGFFQAPPGDALQTLAVNLPMLPASVDLSRSVVVPEPTVVPVILAALGILRMRPRRRSVKHAG